MPRRVTIKLTANFERNLEAIAAFLASVDAQLTYDRLLDDLADTLIPNLENFPALGRPFLVRPVGSVEVANALERLKIKPPYDELREYLFTDYMVLYSQLDNVIHLLAIKHHRQLSFDFPSLWTKT